MTGVLLLLLGLVGVLFYAAVCWLLPYSYHFRCYGDGRLGTCRGCAGTGRRLRRGRRIFNYYWNRRAAVRDR